MNLTSTLRIVLVLLVAAGGKISAADAPPRGRVPVTPAWALECWLWEEDVQTADYVNELLKGYVDHDIPARTIILDSAWSTRYNDFIVDAEHYPNPGKFLKDLQDRGYRVVLWMTPNVNSRSSDTKIKDSADWFNEAKAKGYIAGGGHQQKWWKGLGGYIDYTNPAAMKWWRGLQQQVFDWGIDGWKLDDTSLYFNSPIGAAVGRQDMPPLSERTGQGWMTNREYMDHYYRDEYQHGLTQNPEFIIMGRSIDGPVHPEGFAPLDASPINWVGDQNHSWKAKDEGIEEALNFILASAKAGFCIVGSDVAGYHGKEPIPDNLYIRWAQFSAFCGFFLNGGHGERMLWKYQPPVLENVRRAAWLHNELVPYIYSYSVECNKSGKPLMTPLGQLNRTAVTDGDYRYLFGDDFLIAPIHEDRTQWTVKIPEGRWRYFYDDAAVIQGPTELTRDFPLNEYPVYVREGAIIPMQVSRDYNGLGDKESEGFVTWNIYPAKEKRSFTLHNTDQSGATTLTVEPLALTLSGVKKPHILRVLSDRAPQSVALDGRDLKQGADWRYDTAGRRIIIKTHDYAEGAYRVVLKP